MKQMKKYTLIIIALFLVQHIGFCQAPANDLEITGVISCGNALPISGAVVYLKDASGDIVDTTFSDSSGDYKFTGLLQGNSYSIEGAYNDPELSGLSTFDMVLIARHILAVSPLVGAQAMAADFNNSGSVTTFDMVQLRLLILGIENAPYRISPEWLFLNANTNQKIGLFTLSDNLNLDITAIKRGDINFNACP